jgi:hypothetical protein
MKLQCALREYDFSIIKKIITIMITLAVLLNMASVVSPVSSSNSSDEFTDFRESEHFVFNIPSSYLINEIYPNELQSFLSKMDKLYKAMAELTGFTPYGKIQINYDPLMDPKIKYASGVRGGNIMTLSRFAVHNLIEEISYGNVYWIVVHELGHNLGVYPSFNPEFTADFLALYSSVVTGIPLTDWHERTGEINASLDLWYESEYAWLSRTNVDWSKITPHDTRYGSIITCAVISLVKSSGNDWSSIKKTFQSYYDGSFTQKTRYVGSTNAVNLNEFIDRIDFFSGVDFRSEKLNYSDWLQYLRKEFPVGVMGHVRGGSEIEIHDVLEVLKFLAGIDSLLHHCEIAHEASRITGGVRVNINDVLEMLKHLAGIDSLLG